MTNEPLSSRRRFLRSSVETALASMILPSAAWCTSGGSKLKVDVCIYGGASGGVIAAIALARVGRSVALIEPTRHLGGMTTGGLGWVDIKHGGLRAFGGITGEYYRRVKDFYKKTGVDVYAFGNDGAVAEPHVAEAIIEQMIAEQSKHISIFRESRIASVQKSRSRILSITLDKAPVDHRGAPTAIPMGPSFATVSASMFIDASYEGDLLAGAGVSYRRDRESSKEFGERHAGIYPDDITEFGRRIAMIDPYRKPGNPGSGLIPLISTAHMGSLGSRSDIIQAFNFRLCLVKKDPIPIQPGSNYDPATYEIVARMLAAQAAAEDPFSAKQMYNGGSARLLKISVLPHGKTDVNNAGALSMDFVTGGAERYARATWAERASLWHAHEDYQRGFLYFLQTDPRVASDIRESLSLWGLPRDEFQDTGGWPTQLYVREARRMIGQYIMRQSDCDIPPQELEDSVGLGTYALDSHTCQRLVSGGIVVPEGGFFNDIPGAYPISYRTITPRAEECDNLLVTFCLSSTHVCFASLRMEPPYMVLSESAALAADSALTEGTSVQQINIRRYAKRLQDSGQIVMPRDIPKF